MKTARTIVLLLVSVLLGSCDWDKMPPRRDVVGTWEGTIKGGYAMLRLDPDGTGYYASVAPESDSQTRGFETHIVRAWSASSTNLVLTMEAGTTTNENEKCDGSILFGVLYLRPTADKQVFVQLMKSEDVDKARIQLSEAIKKKVETTPTNSGTQRR